MFKWLPSCAIVITIVKRLSSEFSKAWLYLICLGVGYLIAGWILASFQVPVWVWIGTVLMILHLTRSGSDGIFLAMSWTMGVICVGVIFKSWPTIIPVPNIQIWSISYILLLLLTILLIFGLAFANTRLELFGFNSKQCFYLLILLSGLSLGMGMIISNLI